MKKILNLLKKIKILKSNSKQDCQLEQIKINYENSILGLKDNEDDNLNKNTGIIISLTTYNKRIYDVHLVIESLFRQTMQPKKIILWLAEDEFNENNIPIILKKLKQKGLEIKFCQDLKSYKKLIPTLQLYWNEPIITVDDDIIYPFDFIENLYKKYKKDAHKIYFYIGHKIKIKDKRVLSYKKWEFNYQGLEERIDTLPTGVGGILYPPNSLNKEVLNINKFMKLAPTADDIWFKAMSLLNGTYCQKIYIPEEFLNKFIRINRSQDIGLFKINVGNNKNDIQFKNVFEEYDLTEKLNHE